MERKVVVGLDNFLRDYLYDVADLGEGYIPCSTLEEWLSYVKDSKCKHSHTGSAVGNVMMNLAQFRKLIPELVPRFTGARSDDDAGKQLRETFAAVGIDERAAVLDGDTGRCAVLINGLGERSFRSYLAAGNRYDTKQFEENIKNRLFDDAKLLVVSAFTLNDKKSEIYSTVHRAF